MTTPSTLMDKYDRAIHELFQHETGPDFESAVKEAWANGGPLHSTGCLFQFANCSGRRSQNRYRDGKVLPIGCLTMVRRLSSSDYHAWTDALTAEIQNDERIPKLVGDIKKADLVVFAEWQRRLDKEIRGGGELQPNAQPDI